MALKAQEIAGRITGLRERRGNPAQPVVASAVGVALRTYQNWEAGDAIPRHGNLERLAAYYGVSEEYILTGQEHAVPESPVLVSRDIEDVRAEFQEHVKRMQDTLDRVARNQEQIIRHLGLNEQRANGDQPIVDLPDWDPREGDRRGRGADRRGRGTDRRTGS